VLTARVDRCSKEDEKSLRKLLKKLKGQADVVRCAFCRWCDAVVALD
jgi:LSD1 subclass zinc finger protein